MQKQEIEKQQSGMNSDMEMCIQNCLQCYQVCENELAKAMSQSSSDESHIKLLRACSEICQTSAKFMLIGTELHSKTCGMCSEICTLCADHCESMNNSALKKCIEACRKCADSCEKMSQKMH